MGRKPASASQAPRFSNAEKKKMEKLLDERKNQPVDESFCQSLADKFNLSRNGTKAISAQQVQRWFHTTQRIQVPVTDSEEAAAVPETSSDTHKELEEKAPSVLDLQFEAKSARDDAWYDVATFLAHRVLGLGEAEVCVRFQGFGAEEDEWVNVKHAVRERSIPLEGSDCNKVDVGDLVLCFRETDEQATHFDAQILEIVKRQHDVRGCRCLFRIRYVHDQTEERVTLHKLCCRPQLAVQNCFF